MAFSTQLIQMFSTCKEVVTAKWKRALCMRNTESLPLAKLLGNQAVKSQEERKQNKQYLQPYCLKLPLFLVAAILLSYEGQPARK